MKISIIGAGAMGSLFGGYLSRTGTEVVLYDINREHIDAINKKGLVIEELSEKITVSPIATSNPEEVKGSDLILIFVKSTATRLVVEQFKPLTSTDTILLTLQNGYGNEELIRSRFDAGQTAVGVTSEGATFLSPGIIRHAGKGTTHICMSDKDNSKIIPFCDIFTSAGFHTEISGNIEDLVWSKLVINVGINALTAITGLNNGALLDYEETKDLMGKLINEAVDVAKRKGVKLQYDNPVDAVFSVAQKTSLNRSSMLQDFDRKRTTEIDFINGAIAAEAEKMGVAAPANELVTKLIKTMEQIHRNQKQ